MLKLTTKIKEAIEQPRRIVPYLNQQVKTTMFLLRSNKPRKALYTLLNEVVDIDNLVGSNWSYVVRDVNNTQMVLDLRDRGINRELLLCNVREKEQTEEFINQLKNLKTIYEKIHVLDIGANIGYYTLLEANILGEKHRVSAFEPHPNNIIQLRKSVRLNDFDEFVDIEQCAVGAETGNADLSVSPHSNTHQISDISGKSSTTIEVPMKTIDRILVERELEQPDCVLLRIDVEGFEHRVLEGGTKTLSGNQDMFLFVEVHNSVPQREQKKMIQMLSKSGFELSYSNIRSATTLEDLKTSSGYHMMARKTTGEQGLTTN